MSRGDSRRRSRLTEAGYAAILTALLAATLLIPLTAFAVDVARWYTELERVQTAADAAATAGVTYMPDDFANAKATAIAVSAKNGYPNSGDTAVYVEATSKPSQLRVTVTSKIPNGFGSIFNKPYTTVSRSATADFNGPAPMGSPCNAYGNEPLAAVNVGNASSTGPTNNRGPRSSVIVAPSGGATCTSNPQFWAAIAGPNTPKGNGDAFMTRTCSSGNTGCSGSTNNEFDPLGYIYIVRVKPEAVGVPFTLQVYDPAFVQVGDDCAGNPSQTSGVPFQANMSQFVPLDGQNTGSGRYTPGNSTTFCNGDVLGGGNASDIITSYGLRLPTDTYQPKLAAPISSCQKQYPGYASTMTQSQRLREGNSNYNADVAKVFRQWVDLCTYTPTQSGDYYLQIRTNVALGGTADGQGGYGGNAAVFSQNGDNTAVLGNGNNRFAMRVKGSQRANISISGFQAMGMYANYSSGGAGANSTFNLVRVIPAAATKTLKVGFFDTGDASQPGTLTIQPPPDANMGTSITTCTGSGVVNGNIPGCQLTNVSSATYNGRWQYVNVPIPANYTCSVNLQGGCWFTLRFNFPSGVPNDTTTWTAKIDGDPVRLIQ
jgi:Flp pilus assembly protein TadG